MITPVSRASQPTESDIFPKIGLIALKSNSLLWGGVLAIKLARTDTTHDSSQFRQEMLGRRRGCWRTKTGPFILGSGGDDSSLGCVAAWSPSGFSLKSRVSIGDRTIGSRLAESVRIGCMIQVSSRHRRTGWRCL